MAAKVGSFEGTGNTMSGVFCLKLLIYCQLFQKKAVTLHPSKG